MQDELDRLDPTDLLQALLQDFLRDKEGQVPDVEGPVGLLALVQGRRRVRGRPQSVSEVKGCGCGACHTTTAPPGDGFFFWTNAFRSAFLAAVATQKLKHELIMYLN